MKTDSYLNPALFLQTVSTSLAQLKQQLRHDYELAYPDLRDVIHLVLDKEEARAWRLSVFPHLLFPDLVEAHIANLNLQAVEAKHNDVFTSHHYNEITEPAFALCG